MHIYPSDGNAGPPNEVCWTKSAKKTGVVESPKALDHAGLLFNEPPGAAGLPLV